MKKSARGFAVAGLIVLLALSCLVTPAFAERPQEGIGKWLQEIGFFTGYIQADLKNQDDEQAIPLGVRFGFDLKPFTKKFGFEPKGMLELIYEIFAGNIFQPENNAEMGAGFYLRYSYPLTKKLYPYIEGGTGLYYMTLHTYEQSTQFNFASAGGAGLTYFIKDNVAVNVGYRMRHVSNASIKEPNGGINANMYLVGMSWYF
ncbi:lipid A deacylase PagL [Candidatus Velamenicoccus archaeovorus]|uniref:Lipid A deacylase PagL n=1 Tax=Velamenicoccus archaeovorus TaxID=1930593 RepID=A0A410P597_VELA1|nr:acyloxyacyl hydrolase [Candidatus Velamenicoccus archaeovorus]QAT17356.1 lipid A deacylase PagL [Candidatus Velamenicoccus archaeovorus]